MRTVWKFLVRITDEQEIELPVGAKILCVKVQQTAEGREFAWIWAMVDPKATMAKWKVRIYGTGHHIDGDPGEYVGTIMMHGGALVFHVFIEPEGA